MSLSTSLARSTNNMLIVRSICACARNVAVMLDDWRSASWGWMPSSSSGAMTMVDSGIIRVEVGVNSSVAVGMAVSNRTAVEGAGGNDWVSGVGVVVLGGGVANSASRCRMRSIAAVIAASSDW